MNYAQAKALIESARNPGAGKPLENNTRLYARDGGRYAVRLHATDILTFEPDGSTVYNTGGWKSVTTRARMNEYGPARVWQDKGRWYIKAGERPAAPFQDGVTVTARGALKGAGSLAADTAERKLRAAVGAYSRAFADALYAGKLEAPGAGDCFYCCMKDVATGKPMPGGDHIREHIKEKYYVPSLAANALMERGSVMERSDFAGLTGMQGERRAPYGGGCLKGGVQRAIRRYVYRQLGLAY